MSTTRPMLDDVASVSRTLAAPGVPGERADAPERPLGVDLERGLEERGAELERDRRARAFEREEMELVATNDGIQPAGLGHLHEEAQVGLARLDEARPARPLPLAHDDEADIARELRRELVGGQLEHRAQGLALPEPVEPVVGADPEDMAQVSLVPMLEDRHVTDEQIRIGAHDPEPQGRARQRRRQALGRR